DKFEKTSLPRQKDFYSLLNQQNIKTDVLLLADVIMNYTIMYLKDDRLDPSHYVSVPGMFNDSLYKSSGAKLKLMTDMDQYLIVENGICEGMTMSWIMYEDMNTLYSENGYILEVDIEAPIGLHDFFADYPLVPEKQI
ncbi:31270_t:CDS:2, partial [Racocetra persica]